MQGTCFIFALLFSTVAIHSTLGTISLSWCKLMAFGCSTMMALNPSACAVSLSISKRTRDALRNAVSGPLQLPFVEE